MRLPFDLVPLLVLGLLTGCAPRGLHDGAPCPCLDGYVCCPETQQCLGEASLAACPGLLLSEISPSEGPVRGGTLLTVRGRDLESGVQVFVGGSVCAPVGQPTPDTLNCLVPPGRLGTPWADVWVVAPDGREARWVDGFRYVQPAFLDVTPPEILDRTASGEALAVEDLDRDGRLDLIFARKASSPSDRGVVFLNRGQEGWSDVTGAGWNSAIGGAVEVVAGDFTQDGRPDLVLAQDSSETTGSAVFLLVGAGDGTFEHRSTQALQRTITRRALSAVDLDADGDLDLVGCRTLTESINPLPSGTGLLNVGGDFVDEPGLVQLDEARFDREDPSCRAAALGDLDNDGVPELALAGRFVSILGLEDGSYIDQSHQHDGLPTALATELTALGFVDYDADGDLDLFGIQRDRHGTLLFENRQGRLRKALPLSDGAQLFDPLNPAEGAALRFGQRSAAWVDVDLDGDLDLLVPEPMGTEPRQPLLYSSGFAAGRRGFEARLLDTLPLISAPTQAVAVDLDGDGDEEVVIAAGRGRPNRRAILDNTLFENAGTSQAARGWALRVRPVTDPDGDATDATFDDDRVAYGVRVDVDLDGPLSAPDFEGGLGRLAVRMVVSESSPVAHFGIPDGTGSVWVRARFADGSETRSRVEAGTGVLRLPDCNGDCQR